MIDDLLKNHLQRGMTRAEVRRIMGPPDFADSTRLSRGWDYEIGVDVSDCSFVYVGFDRHGRLIQWFDSRDPLDKR
jgi:outer membrane protein assembly factor BamE (lipoprotein component of BamABCDE complex)